jgi:DNA-directed RNA polymerase beta' subunit
MNVFVPQSIQTQIELEEIADVKRQIISPSSSSTSIGLVQDGLVGSYNLTGPTVKIDWRNAMNIISYTSFENMKKIDKDKHYTGQEVFSLIIPPGININGENNFKVKDSVLMEGSRLGKAVLGEKKKFALHQIIWDEYGTEETKTFIDNTQKLVNNFNLYNGFSVGYGDACVDKSVNENIDKLFVTINQKVDHMITELENNPEMMDKDVFEYKLQQEYGIVLDSVSKLVMASLKPDNSFFVMSDKGSGSKGSSTNIGQIIGCLGLQAIEGKIAPKKYNNRTLPYFHQHDDRGASRGLIREPYIDGLSFPSFTFLLMAGREGIIDQALKSVTGDTPIIIMEDDNIKRVQIGEWIDSHLKLNSKYIEHHQERQMELLKLKEKVFIPTTDFDGKVSWGEITAITRHDPGNELYEIKTKGGRNVIVTESKSLLIWDKNTNKLIHTSTPTVKIGDLVPVTMNLKTPPNIINSVDVSKYLPKNEYIYGTDFNKAVGLLKNELKEKDSVTPGWWNINNNKNFTLPYDKAHKLRRCINRSLVNNICDGCVYPYSAYRQNIKFEDTFKLTKENGQFIGLFLAEGNVDIKSGYIGITNNDKNIINFVQEWFESRNMKTTFESHINKIGGRTTSIRGYSTIFAKFLTEFLGHGARNKFVPVEAYNAPEEFIIGLIDGYFSGDGTVYDDAIQVCSASPKLIEGISFLLNRLNIFGKISVTQMKENNLGTKDIASSNVLNIRAQWATRFSKKITLLDNSKQLKLNKLKVPSSHKNYKEFSDVILDPIISISKVDVNKYPKVYDLTVPSTLNFGLANGLHVVDTAETGYAQRRLIKSEEDVMIKYDCSLRTANEMLLQIVYGDSGADTTKQYLYNIDLAHMSNEDLKKRFQFSPEEMKNFKDFKSSDNDKIFEMIKFMRDEFRVCMKKARCDFKTVVSKIAFPVNFTRIIDNVSANKSLQKGDLVQPMYVHEQLEKILDNKYLTLIPMSEEQRRDEKSIKNIDERVFKTFLKTALYNALAPKKCCIEKKFSKVQFDMIIKDIISTYNRSVVQPGEMVGIIGAQSMGEPLTQMSSSSLSKILIKNKTTGDIYYGKVGQFMDKILEDNKKDLIKVPKHKDSVIYKPKDEYLIIGVSDKEKTSWNKISEFSRHPANGQLMTITTKTKRTTTTTLSHSHLARKNHKVVPVKGADLKVGDRIPVVLTVKMPEPKREQIKIGENEYKLDKDFGWFCGAYIADGCINGNNIRITKIIPIFEKRIKKISKLFGKELRVVHYQGKYGPGKDQIFSHKDLATFLETNFGNGSYNKKIPAFAFDSNEEFVSGLIGGYFDGDGNFESKKCSIRVGSRSKELIEGLSILLSYFGIFGSFVDETTVNQPGKVMHTYQVMRKYDTTFKEKIFLCVEDKINELDKLIEVNSREKKTNNNFVDMIEGLGESIAFIGKKLKLPGQSRLYGRWLKKPAIGRETLAKYVETFTEELDKYEKVDEEDKTKELVSTQLELLKQALTAEVIWDEIISIEILDDPKEYVYDFTVPGNDSFMVDAGVLVHNTLNTFHVAGIKTMSSTTHGVPRVKEILGVSKNLRTPQLLMQLLPEYAKNKDMARKVASNLKYTTIGDIRGRINVFYDPEPEDENSIMKEDNVKNAFYNQKAGKTACQGDYKGLPWLMRIEIVKEKMLEKEISLLDIKSKFCNWWEKRFVDSKLLKKEEKKVINKITNISVLSNTDNDLQPVIHIRFNVKDADKSKDPFNREMLNEFIDHIIDKFKLKGIESITNINDIAPEKLTVVDETTGELKQEEHYMIYTAGTNLIDIRYLVGVDIYNTISNDIVDVYKHFGIEIARTRLLRELYDAYDQAGHAVSYTNISILVDIMTSNGILMSIDRHGMNKSDTDVLGRASFERAVDQILTAGVFGETDHMKGVSSRVMAGLVIKGGTGYCDVILDTNTIEKSEYSDETNKYRTHIDIMTDGVANDIMKNDMGEMFIPE